MNVVHIHIKMVALDGTITANKLKQRQHVHFCVPFVSHPGCHTANTANAYIVWWFKSMNRQKKEKVVYSLSCS